MLPGDFIAPMLGMTAKHPFDGADWWFEVKWDGFRAIISRGPTLNIFSRYGHDLLAAYPALVQVQDDLPDSVVLDAELVAWVNGRPSFSHLQRRDSAKYLLMVFDCLYSDGQWHLHKPLETRLEHLRHAVKSQGMIVINEGVKGRGRQYFDAVTDQGLEGVMAKRLDARYMTGRRSPLWQKFLAWSSDWFWVTRAKQMQDGQWFWSLSQRSGSGWRDVGTVHAPRDWDASDQVTAGIVWQPFRVEVAYRERTREGHLRHARVRQ